MENIVFYGTRGTCSLTSSKYQEFGGATTCIMLNIDNQHIMIDCGSGINNAIEDLKDIDELHLFISHTHLDHISGVPTLLSVFENKKLHIYGKTFDNISIKDSIYRIMSKDLWPVRADTYKNVEFHDIENDIQIGNITVKNMDSYHPGGCSLFRFNYGMNSIVTAFDFCHLNGYDEKLVKFAKDCTTLIYDGTMSEQDLKEKPTWGHSTPEEGCKIASRIGCKNVIITHFGIFDDDTLTEWENNLHKLYPNCSFARSGQSKDELKKMVEIGSLLASEKDTDTLLLKVVETCMDIANADGGTLYLLNKDQLDFKVLINKSKNTKFVRKDSPISMPSVKLDGKNASAASAREKKIINIEDCYTETRYDCSGSQEYDKLNGYRTKSILVIPLVDEFDDIVGVLQLINATNKQGEVVPFNKNNEEVLLAIANQASVSIVNNSYSQKINDLLYGFVKVMSVEIDERTPYNANHTRNMVKFADNFLTYEENTKGKYAVDEKKKREILMSIWLHDIGKILTPLEIMNKDSRLGDMYNDIKNRFDRRELLLKLQFATKHISEREYKELEQERKNQLELIEFINRVGFLSDDLKLKLNNLSIKTYKELDGSITPIITKEEYHELSIVKGTLTVEERAIMQDHVSKTQKILSQLNFPKYYDNIPMYAGNHHEFLNGSGYPNHLTEIDLPWPCRLITICDIFEALTAKDRPYKKQMSTEVAFKILNEMADAGQLDKAIIDEFEKSKAWEQ